MADVTTEKIRSRWSHKQIATLCSLFMEAGPNRIQEIFPDSSLGKERTWKEAETKLIEFEFMPKPDSEILAAEVEHDVNTFIAELEALAPRQRILAARYMIASCKELLPKRAAPKAPVAA